MNPNPFHLRATLLPDGDAPVDLWIEDGRFSFSPRVGAEELAPAGGHAIAGLVDAHAHSTSDFGRTGLPAASPELIAENRRRQRDAGVLYLRDIGAVTDAILRLPVADDLPRQQVAARYLAPPAGYSGIQRDTPAQELAAVASAQAEAGAQWVKLIGDWPREPASGPIPALHRGELNYAAETMASAVLAAHARGARVAIHAMSHEAVAAAIAAGVDSIEHANAMDEDLLRAMAARRIAWTPTIASFQATLRSAERRGIEDVAMWLRGCFERLHMLLPLARSLGITVLAGTDVLGPGAVAREIAALQEFGLTPAEALAAASSAARSYLGEPGIEEGAPADLVLYAGDPRSNPELLSRPALIMLAGRVIARPA